MTKSEEKILRHLAENPIQLNYTLRRAAGLSHRGYWIVLRRMEEKRLAAMLPSGGQVTLTFGGIRKLKELGVEVRA